MPAPEYYEAVFRWPHQEAQDVIVTGDFDSWSCSQHLPRSSSGFEGTIRLPWGRKVAYKYIVDGRWATTNGQPTELDPIGNLNNVYNTPARPPTPKAVTPEPQSAGQVNGVLATAKDTAVAIVESIAPGTTQTPAESPTSSTDSSKEPAYIPVDSPKTTLTTAVSDSVDGTVEAAKEELSQASQPTEQPVPETEPDLVPTPKEEINVEAPLSVEVEDVPKAPEVPVPILPLTAVRDASPTSDLPAQPVSTVVEGTVTAEPSQSLDVEPSTHDPAGESKVGGSFEGTKLVPEPIVPTAAATEAETSPLTSPVSDENTVATPTSATLTAPTNGKDATSSPAAIPLPPPTPAEVPLPPTPATNGKPATPSTSTPTTPRKEKKHAFPTFGRHHRQSSSSASLSTAATDEHGSANDSPSRKGSRKEKKRTSSFFGKIKEIFSDDHHHNKEKK
ncbi:hypothetical protein PHLCEN_2v1305 [Hermanssonia centrifuga]|uniref:AMP-activated protein kinase glycogen-binding domain-containing protein n=1 Tax=Hermanssonia centrifuga TaxID=98765 RepID=A0A2R6S3L0_9APHY|nr:hypothetical protein PHLCEN_2v1305 [Hermanssonia centrifuga]